MLRPLRPSLLTYTTLFRSLSQTFSISITSCYSIPFLNSSFRCSAFFQKGVGRPEKLHTVRRKFLTREKYFSHTFPVNFSHVGNFLPTRIRVGHYGWMRSPAVAEQWASAFCLCFSVGHYHLCLFGYRANSHRILRISMTLRVKGT